MASTTNWGDVQRDIEKRLRELIPDTVKTVQSGTEEDLMAWAPKAFPAVFVLWTGAPLDKRVTMLTNRFSSKFVAGWQLHHFCVTNKPDDVGLFADDGVFAVSLATREKLLGKMPEGQVNNSAILFSNGEGRIEKFTPRSGSGALKIVVPYELDQIIGAV